MQEQKGYAVTVPALYRVSLRMASDIPNQPPRRWTNTLYNGAPSAGAAAIAGVAAWTTYLRNTCHERVFCYEVYATDNSPTTDNFSVVPVDLANQRGTIATPAGEPYLPKACVSVTISVPGSRPSRKFWRPGLYDADVTNGVTLAPALVEAISDYWNDLITNLEGFWLDVDGQELLTGVRLRLTTREFGRESTADVPAAPPLG